MRFTLSVFDLLSNAVPGAIGWAVILYVSQPAGWFDASSLLELGSIERSILEVLSSVLLSNLLYPIGLGCQVKVLGGSSHSRQQRPPSGMTGSTCATPSWR